ncbi:hypothetical protein [Actinomadura nitritigenes]|uniref:hypothetical protein n=1 Tax=Actinomadura nitritigenes TaxID=134602 RepID=UPI003D89E620
MAEVAGVLWPSDLVLEAAEVRRRPLVLLSRLLYCCHPSVSEGVGSEYDQGPDSPYSDRYPARWSMKQVRLLVQSMTWRGGANVPSNAFGRVNATWPWVSLNLDHFGLVLKVATKTFRLTSADVAVVYPCRGMFSRGIGIGTVDGRVLVFWTGRGDAVLAALGAAGFQTSRDIRNAYRGIRSGLYAHAEGVAESQVPRGQLGALRVFLLLVMLCVVAGLALAGVLPWFGVFSYLGFGAFGYMLYVRSR